MICLVMIVRNEAKTIERTLASVLPHVDRVCIVDTGSTDDTWRLAREMLANWEGLRNERRQFVQDGRKWVDYSTNRNGALALAAESFPEADWLFMLDADTEVHNGHMLQTLNEDFGGCRAVEVKLARLIYPMRCLVRASELSKWQYRGRVHETLIRTPARRYDVVTIMRGLWVEYLGTDAGADKMKQWEAHIPLLKQDLVDACAANDHAWAARTRFYLGQTYACLGDWTSAAAWYISRFYDISPLTNKDEDWYTKLQLAWVCHEMGKLQQAAVWAKGCTDERPWRAEGWCRRALIQADGGNWEECLNLIQDWSVNYRNSHVQARAHDRYLIQSEMPVKIQLLWARALLQCGRPTAQVELEACFQLDLSPADRLYVKQLLATLKEQTHGTTKEG